MAEKNLVTMEKIVSWAKRRGFVFPGSEIYGGLANSWDFGPYGTQLKKNIRDHWWRFFVESREDVVGLDAAIIMNPKVWEASGHTTNFSDPLVECKACHERFRADQIDLSAACPACGAKESFTEPKQFNILMQTALGAVEGEKAVAYLRGETAQAMFIDFPAIQQMSRKKLPFGIAQSGKAFRNEITPGNFIFRTREFDLMEFEYFFDPKKTDWQALFEHWKSEMEAWMEAVGIAKERLHAVEIPDGERAHYSERTIDFEFEYPFGQKELFGLAYRGDYDMQKHQDASGKELGYLDPDTNERVLPHVIEPAFGADRAMLAILLSAYQEEEVAEGPAQKPSSTEADKDIRIVLKLRPAIAPVQVAVFPLLKNKPELVARAREVFDQLRPHLRCEWDDNGNVGKRYRRQDEIGTPYCVTVDFDSLSDGAVTVRDRDTMEQERVAIAELESHLASKLAS